MILRFGEWVLDVDARQLRRGRDPVHVSPKAFQLLRLLVERRPRAISKTELHTAIWPATFVSDGSLAQLASEVRAAIGDDAHEPRFLRTVHGYGYAFAGEAVDLAVEPAGTAGASASYWLHSKTGDVQLAYGENVFGRDATSTIRLDSLRISRYHARIVVTGDDTVLEDLGSKNGTYLGDEKITRPARLKDGDRIRIGPFSFVFQIVPPGATTETEIQEPPGI